MNGRVVNPNWGDLFGIYRGKDLKFDGEGRDDGV